MPLRVISGRFKGRNLFSPPGLDTRPSSGRMRLAVHNSLGPGALDGASVLDLYAGTGASGIEALSRGAARALFVETARPALDALRKNIDKLRLGKDEAEVLHTAVVPTLRRHPPLPFEPFGAVFCDPPYELFHRPLEARALADALGGLVARNGLTPGAVVVVEHPAEWGFVRAPAGLVEVNKRRYSAAGVTFYRLKG